MYKLLVVDDERSTLNGLCNYIPWEQLGFLVEGRAENGKQALEFLQDHEVDVILSDIRMPVMDGIELVRRLRDTGRDTEVVFLSAHRDFEYAKEGLRYGVYDYILKPTKFAEISEVFGRMKEKLAGCEKQIAEQEEDYQSIISIVKKYAADHVRNASLEEAASLVKMNPQYLSRLFKKKNGSNFSDYVMEQKMKQAQRLLGNPRYRIGEISEMLGYTNAKNFARAFHSFTGMSPKEYRDSREAGGGQRETEPFS